MCYNSLVNSAPFPVPCEPMRPRPAVLLTFPTEYLRPPPVIPLESTPHFTQFWWLLSSFRMHTYTKPASVDSKTTCSRTKFFRCNTYKKQGGGAVIMVNQMPETNHASSTSALCLRASVAAASSIFRTLFQVPYAVSPLLATLTKTAGVWGYSSHSGTHQARVTSLPRPCHEPLTSDFPFSARRLRETSAFSASLRYPFLLRSEPSTFNFQLSTSAFHFQSSHQPRNNHLPENHRIGPHFHLPSQVPALRINPRLFRHVPVTQDQVRIRYRNLRIQSSRDDQHRRSRFSEELLVHQRQFRKLRHHVIHVVDPFDDGHKRWRMVEQVLPVPKHGVKHVVLLKEEMRRRRLRAHGLQARPLNDGQLRSPVTSPTHAVNGNSRLVHFGPGLQIIQHAREHAIRCRAYFDWRLPGARSVDSKKSYAVRQDCAKVFGQIFLTAVQAANRQYQRHRALRIFRQPYVADDLGALKRDANDLQGWVPETCVSSECLERFGIGALLPGRSGYRPAAKGI